MILERLVKILFLLKLNMLTLYLYSHSARFVKSVQPDVLQFHKNSVLDIKSQNALDWKSP